jgi:hypothetical protein
VVISLALTGTLWLVALALIVATRGRLGLAHDRPAPTVAGERLPNLSAMSTGVKRV